MFLTEFNWNYSLYLIGVYFAIVLILFEVSISLAVTKLEKS